MLRRIWVRNLACFGDEEHRLDLSPETVLVGPNNVGKSVMIGAYNFVRHFAIRGNWEFDTTSYRWGSHANIAYRHGRSSRITMGIGVEGHWTGNFSVDLNPPGYTFAGSRDETVFDELRKGWYFAPSRNEIPPSLQVGMRPQDTAWSQPLDPYGSNVITYLLERYTSRDPRWDVAEQWLTRIDPQFSILKSPLRGNQGSIETSIEKEDGVDINMAYQGTGIQKAVTVITALVFSPKGSTIIIEEPELHLHPRSQEVLVDLFNLAVNEWEKQVIFTTHSWNMLLPFISDIGTGSTRGEPHVKADQNKFKLVSFSRTAEAIEVKDYDLRGKNFRDVRDHFKHLWG